MENKWFSISGVGTAIHNSETRKKWEALPNDKSKSDYGRLAILKYAEDEGFERAEIEEGADIIEEAFNYLRGKFPDISGMKSFILRNAIIHYS